MAPPSWFTVLLLAAPPLERRLPRQGTAGALKTLALILLSALALQSRDSEELLRREHGALTRQLSRTDDGLPLSTDEKIFLLRAFVDGHEDRSAHPLVLRSRSRLGDLYLLSDPEKALEEFDSILTLAGGDTDLRGRARYGRAQACLQMGNTRLAADILGILVREEAGTRYGRYALTALTHLNSESVLRPGFPLPAGSLGRDLAGRTVSTQTLRGEPALLVFWSTDSPTSVELVEHLAETWARDGTDEVHFVALALDGSRARVAALARERGWRFTTVLCEGGFLDPTALALRVTGVPTSLLMGADGTFLARDLSPGRLGYLLRRARGR